MGHPKGDLGVHAGRYQPNSPTPSGLGGRPYQGSPCHSAQNTGPTQTLLVHRRTLTTRSADLTGCSRLLHAVVQHAQGVAGVHWFQSTRGNQTCLPRRRQRHPKFGKPTNARQRTRATVAQLRRVLRRQCIWSRQRVVWCKHGFTTKCLASPVA